MAPVPTPTPRTPDVHPEDSPTEGAPTDLADGASSSDSGADSGSDSGPRDPAPTSAAAHPRRQWSLLLRCAHPGQAFAFAVATVALALLGDREVGPAFAAGGAVLLMQLIAGLLNDAFDAELDRRADRDAKPIAQGLVPRGNATFVATALALIAVPVALQNGITAGLILLATLPVAFLHNRWLHRTPLSFVGWMATVPMIGAFLTHADWGNAQPPGTPPAVTLAALALVGLCAHLVTSLRHLPADHAAGIKPLPLLIALRTGAPVLMYVTIALCLLAALVCVLVGLDPGLHP